MVTSGPHRTTSALRSAGPEEALCPGSGPEGAGKKRVARVAQGDRANTPGEPEGDGAHKSLGPRVEGSVASLALPGDKQGLEPLVC